jgi:alpha-mannosidase
VNITNTVTLRKDARWVEVTTEFDNPCEDHYLQVSFPTGITAEFSAAQGQFDVVCRPVQKLDYTQYDEIPMTEQPMNSFVDYSDGTAGLALLNEGLKAYEAHGDADGTVSLTLLRCFPLRICVTTELLDYTDDKGSQCLGKHSFRYAILPHAGDWEQGGVWSAAERFNGKLLAGQIGLSPYGSQPMARSFVELRQENLHLSAIKRSEDGKGWIVRLFNPSDATVRNAVRLNGGHGAPDCPQSPLARQAAKFRLPIQPGLVFADVSLVTLEELPQQPLAMDADGWVPFEITGKRILTIRFA